MIKRLYSLEETINKLSEAKIASKASSSYHNNDRDGFSWWGEEESWQWGWTTRLLIENGQVRISTILWGWSRWMVQSGGSIFWISRDCWQLKGVIGFISFERRSQPMVAMVASSLQGRRMNCNVGDIWRRALGTICTHKIWGFWWSIIKGPTSGFLEGLSKGVWEVGQSSSWLDSKSVGEHIHGWT